MGTWGVGVGQNDTFCEIQEAIRDKAKTEVDPQVIMAEILSNEADNPDYINVLYALSDALWHCNALSPELLERIIRLDTEGIDQAEWRSYGADERMLKKREEKLRGFIARLSRQPHKNEVWRLDKPVSQLPKRGQLFWYRINNTAYGALVIDVQDDNYLLVGVSEALEQKKSYRLNDILNAPIYTLAWFDEFQMLPLRRRHEIAVFDISGDYNGKFGLSISECGIYLTNCGQSATWKHEFRSMVLHGKTMSALLPKESVAIMAQSEHAY